MDTITCSAATSACEKGGEWPQALEHMSMIAGSRIQMNNISCNAAIRACEKDGEWSHALELVSTNGKRQHPDGGHHLQCCHQSLREVWCVDASLGAHEQNGKQQHPDGHHHVQC